MEQCKVLHVFFCQRGVPANVSQEVAELDTAPTIFRLVADDLGQPRLPQAMKWPLAKSLSWACLVLP